MSYPTTCSFGHAAIILNDDSELQTHLSSEHPKGDINAIRRALSSSTSTNDQGIPTVVLTSALSRLGIKVDDLHSITASELSDSAEITPESALSFISSFGASLEPAIDPSKPFFLLDFLKFCLRTSASEETDSAGGFLLKESAGAKSTFVTWTSFKNAAKAHYGPKNLPFTMRKLMRTFDLAFWEMWSDPKIKSLDDVRANGTPLSRRWTYPDGTHPKAYVLVPELFTNHLTQAERLLRISSQDTVRKVVSDSSGDVTYEGYDADQDYASRHSDRTARLSAAADRLSSQAGPPASGSYTRPWQSLNPSFGGGLGFR
jgi:hypothetical protein